MKIERRNQEQMMDLILGMANRDERIRSVILNGSRASPSGKSDIFQDYDIIFIVKDVLPFVSDKVWIDSFGQMLIMQMPDEMDGAWEKAKDKYTYLMRFTDCNRIDLTCMTLKRYQAEHRDSQSILLLDKDNTLGEFKAPSDYDYLPIPPTRKEFDDCCNEFLWVSTYVAKGIFRKELLYAKFAAENICKQKLIEMMSWNAAIKTQHQKPIGMFAKHLKQYTEPTLWMMLRETYVSSDYKDIWFGLFKMLELFNIVAMQGAGFFSFKYDQDEYQRVLDFLKEIESKAKRNSQELKEKNLKNTINIIVDETNNEHITQKIYEGLKSYNESKIGNYVREPYTLYIKSEDDKVVAGVSGDILPPICGVHMVWVEQSLRNQGVGTQMFKQLENYAKDKGCEFVQADTSEFQARQFYEGLGYEIIASLPRNFKGHDTYIFRKSL